MRAMTVTTPLSTLVILANGPGEVSGWAVPIAAEARLRAAETGLSVEVSLCLLPCQFASGQEGAAASGYGVFDHVIEPKASLRLGLGLSGWRPSGRPVVLHVGGDFWYPGRLARRWRAEAYAFVERAHVARSHRIFRGIFVPTEELRERLIRYRVRPEKIIVTGDPRHDAVLLGRGEGRVSKAELHGPRILFLAGSRDSVFSAVFPYWVKTASALRRRLPEARLIAAISPFVSPSLQSALVDRYRDALDSARVEVEYGAASHAEGADLALTIPGTNTMELAIMRIPSLVVLPFGLAPQIPAEGAFEWVTRIPRLGPALRLYLARRYIRHRPYLALPNMRLGRKVMPELTGDVSPEQVAAEAARLIEDPAERARLASELAEIPAETGAARRVVEAMHPLWAVS